MLVIRVPGRGEEKGPLEGWAVSTEEGTVAPCSRPHEETWKLLSLLHMKGRLSLSSSAFLFLTSPGICQDVSFQVEFRAFLQFQ